MNALLASGDVVSIGLLSLNYSTMSSLNLGPKAFFLSATFFSLALVSFTRAALVFSFIVFGV